MTISEIASAEAKIQNHASELVPEDFILVVSLVKKQEPNTDIIKAAQIQAIVCDYLGKQLYNIWEKTNKQDVVTVRKYISYLTRRYTKLPLRLIAERSGLMNKKTGKGDHAGVIHHCNDIENLLSYCDKTNHDIKTLSVIIETRLTA